MFIYYNKKLFFFYYIMFISRMMMLFYNIFLIMKNYVLLCKCKIIKHNFRIKAMINVVYNLIAINNNMLEQNSVLKRFYYSIYLIKYMLLLLK